MSLPAEWIAGTNDRAFERAVAAYQSPGRAYHTWEHVLACIEQMRSFPSGEDRLVFLSLVFHDAIYEPGRGDNERRSAAFAREVLSSESTATKTDLAAIETMILATRDHLAEGRDLARYAQVMLDIDLSVLGSDRDTYARYADAIREEFVPAVATPEQFRIGRSEFLARLLASPHLFLTEQGRKRWESAARTNLEWEAASLRTDQP